VNQENTYAAHVNTDGAQISISAPSMTVLAALLARLGLATPAPSPAVTADEKAAVLGKPAAAATAPTRAAPAAKTTAAPAAPSDAAAPGKSNSAAPADKPSSAGTPADASAVTYDDVKKVVNALYAIEPDHAVTLLAEFKVQNGKQLDTTQWIAFVEQGRAKLAQLQEGAPA
jgi:hypothetical protein